MSFWWENLKADQKLTEILENITVKVNFLGATSGDVGIHDISLTLRSLSNLKDLLKKLAEKLGMKFQQNIFDPKSDILNKKITIIVNGRHYTTLDGLETRLKNDDEISFFPPLGGG